MKLQDILSEEFCYECDTYDEVYIDSDLNVYDEQDTFIGKTDEFQIDEDWGSLDGEQLVEASKRQWKRRGKELLKRYRCTSGPKKGKLVSDPSKCASRKDPKKVRQGRKVMRTKKNTIARKTKIAKRTQLSKIVSRMNDRLMGKKPSAGSGGSTKQKSTSTQKSKSTQKPKKPKS